MRAQQSRTLTSYLLLPRPGDVAKWLIIPLGFLLGVAGRGFPGSAALVRGAVAWFLIEVLVYQARYQWNDVRGFVADQQHPGGDRGRLPGPLSAARSRVSWSAAVAVGKVVTAVVLGFALPGVGLGWFVLSVAVAIFAVAVLYEALRSGGTGHSGDVPPPLHPSLLALWVMVGAGYAIRGVTGLALAVHVTHPPALLITASLALWAFGISWVTSRWAIEATVFATLDADGSLSWSAASQQAREHSLALVRWLPARIDPKSIPGSGDLRRWRAVWTGASYWAPWNLAGVLCGCLSAACGVLLVAPGTGPGSTGVVSVVAAACSLGVVVAGRYRWITPVAGAVVIGLVCLAVRLPSPFLAALPWLTVSTAQVAYLWQDHGSLGRLPTTLRRLCSRLLTGSFGAGLQSVARAALGQATWRAVTTSQDSHTAERPSSSCASAEQPSGTPGTTERPSNRGEPPGHPRNGSQHEVVYSAGTGQGTWISTN